ncbi:MAG: OmpA family protein [Alphaproteobacteria bacterium]|nr:OmpA family protein [Alphaproteobacteria bacterium]
MTSKSNVSLCAISRVLAVVGVLSLAACAHSTIDTEYAGGGLTTPTVDYVEGLDVYSAPHRDSFLNQLAMNYRSYAIYNARTSGQPNIGELFAQKAVAAFSGQVPYPETIDNWPVEDDNAAYDLMMAYNDMIELFQYDANVTHPELAAELQAKYDCWLSATASGQMATARECQTRFENTLTALRDCTGGRVINPGQTVETVTVEGERTVNRVRSSQIGTFYPETVNMSAMRGTNRARDGVIIVNNVNVPEHLINPEPVQPMVFNQNIYGGDKTLNDNSTRNSNNVERSGNTHVTEKKSDCPCAKGGGSQQSVQDNYQPVSLTVNSNPVVLPPQDPNNVNVTVNNDVSGGTCNAAAHGGTCPQKVNSDCPCANDEPSEITIVADGLASRDEFIELMMMMRSELAAINARLDELQAKQNVPAERMRDETTVIKVQQIPVEPKQHVMEEVFEIRFDFDKAIVKPEYDDIIRQLAQVTQANRNVKISVVGHTDTAGSQSYNYALGGRRAEAVQKMLIERGIPSSQIVAVSAGEEDLKVPTPDGVPNAENRRVRVVKEVTFTEPAGERYAPVADVNVEQFYTDCENGECETEYQNW